MSNTGTPPLPRFNRDDLQSAADAWGANCGPAALAAITGRTLDEVRAALPGFDGKHYTNPKMMLDGLANLGAVPTEGAKKNEDACVWPKHGLARIQWEGPWTMPGMRRSRRYRHSHWVACDARSGAWIFDVNAVWVEADGGGWVTLRSWERILVPAILAECEPQANGQWHITHALEIRPQVN